jgi:hypothetical protein
MSASGPNADTASPALTSRHHDRQDNSDSITTRAWALSADPQGRAVVRIDVAIGEQRSDFAPRVRQWELSLGC